MWNMLWPLLLIVSSNCFYNICTKSTPTSANTFAGLTVTYLVGAILSAVLFAAGTKPAHMIGELTKLNWTSVVLGIAIVGLEAGYVHLYRAGWPISTGALVGNICLAVALLIIGILLYHETVSLRQIIGIAICAVGLVLITQ